MTSVAEDVVAAVEDFLHTRTCGNNDYDPEDFLYQFVPSEYKIACDTIDYGDTRWEGHEAHVFALSDGSHVAIDYSYGLTENQDSRGIAGAAVVVPKTVSKIVWVSP